MKINNNTFEPLGLSGIHHVFQPLWNLENWSISGYECFLRSNSNLNPEEIFSEARKNDCLFQLDIYSLTKAIEEYAKFSQVPLFINIFPSTILHEEFPLIINELLDTYPKAVGRFILELNESTEEEQIWLIPALKEKIRWLQDQGVSIAIDDVGKGAASLQKMVEFQPCFVKLDRYFSEGLSESRRKQKIVSFLSTYCLEENITLVLEGIETPSDLACAKALKISLGQGYILGRPTRM